jgi:hypothetical protein
LNEKPLSAGFFVGHLVGGVVRFEVRMSLHVEGFGCRPIAAMRLAPWPASESLQ